LKKNDRILPSDTSNNEILTFVEIFDTYLSKSTAGFCLIDAGYNIVYVNKTLEKITGYTKNEIIGRNITDFLSYPSPEVQNAIKHYTGEALKDEPPLIFEFDLIRKEGKHKWVEVTILPVYKKESDSPIGFIANFNDKSEIRLIEEQGKFATYAFRAIHEGTIVIDPNLKILQFNSAAERIFDINASQAIGKDIREVIRIIEPREAELKEQLDNFYNDKEEAHWEHLIETQKGTVWTEVFMQKIRDNNNRHIASLAIVADITERKKAEEKLRTSDAAFKSIQEGTFIMDLNWSILQSNESGARIYGLKESQIIGKTIFEFIKIIIPSEDEVKQEYADFEKNGYAHFEHYVNCPAGLIWTEVILQKIKNERGQAIGNLAIVADITERKNYIETLNFSDAAFKSIQEGTFLMDVEGRILSINEAAERIYGVKSEEVTGKTILEFIKVIIPPKDELERKLAENREKGYAEYEQMAECPSGLKWTHNVLQQIKDENGKVIGSLGISTDITERKKIEESMRFSDMAIKSIKEGLAFTNMDNTITTWNEACEQICGIKASEAIGRNLWDIVEILDARPEELEKEMHRFLTKGFMISHKLVKVNKKVFWLEVSAHLIKDDEGNNIAVLSIITDISENKKIEESLRFSDAALKSIKEGIIITDTEGVITEWNEASEKIHEIPALEAIGKKLYQIIDILKPSLQERHKQFGSLLQSGYLHAEQLIRVNGREKWTETSMQLVKNEDGKITSILAIVSDITERKKIEQERADEATRRRILIDQSGDGIVVLDKDGKVFEANKRFAEMLGYTAEEIKELHIWDWELLIPREKLLKMLRTIDEKGHHIESKHRRKDGTIYDVEMSNNGADFAGQKLVFCVCRDVTARKQAEDALKLEKDYIRGILDTAPSMIITFDNKGKIINLNHYTEKLSGYSADEIIGKDWLSTFIPERERKLVEETMAKAISGVASPGFTTPVLIKNGQERLIAWYSTIISDNDGNITSVILAGQDVTERQKTERELKQAYNIINRSKMAAFVWRNEKDWPVDFVTENVEQVLGYTAEEFTTGKINYIDIVHQDDYKRVASEVADNIKDLTVMGFEHKPYRVIKKTGEIIWVSDKTEIIRDEKGNTEYLQGVIEDVTENKQTEDVLRFSDAAFKSIREGTLITDLNFNIIDLNKAGENMFGVKNQDVVGKHHSDFIRIIEPSKEQVEKEYRIYAEQGDFHYEHLIEVPAGRIWVDVIWQKIKNDSGEDIANLAIFADITERKKMEESLRFSDAALKSIQEGMIVSDKKLNVISINKAGEKIFGIKACDVIGKNLMHQITSIEPSAEEIDERAQKFLATGREWRFEHKIKAPAGEIWIDILMQKIKDNKGNYIANLAIINDITPRKQAETAIKESEERYRNITESTFEIIQSVDRDGKFLYVNNAWYKILGYSKEDLKSMTFIDILHPDSLEHCQKVFKDILSGKHVRNVEARFRTKDGQTVIVEGNVMPRLMGDRVVASLGFYSDVTKRKQAEEAIKEDSNTRKKLFDQTPVGIVYIDLETAGILNFNNMACRQLGYSRKEFAALSVTDIEALEDKEKVMANIALLRKKRKIEFETLHKTKAGEIRNVNVIAQLINISGRDICQTIWQDITERKKIEEALHFSDKAFKSIREAIIITDIKEGRILFCNEANERLYHVKKEDALGKFVLEVIHVIEPPMEQLHRDHLTLLMRGSARFEHLVQIDEKNRIWVEVFAQVIKDDKGEDKAIMNIALDITERKKMEEELHKKEASLAEAQKIAKVGSWYLDMENDELVWSDEMFRLFGYEPGEIVPTRELFMKHVYEEDLHILKSTIGAHERGEYQEESSNVIARFLRKNGEVWYGNSKARSIFDKSGHVIKEYGSVQDISDIKEAEEKERRIQNQLTTASRMASIGEVASGLAHEINDPLTGVIGFSQLLVDRDIPEDIKDDIEMINFEAQRAAKIVGGLLTFAQKDEYGFTLSDINRIILDTLDLRKYEMDMKGIGVVTELDKNLPKISVDEVQLQQAFLNIVLNAEQAIENANRKGVLTVKSEFSDRVIRIFFIDDGPGISKENLKNIFSPFFKIEADRGGIGLGLSMTRSIITQHGGKISVQSEPQHGTKFIVELPAADINKNGGEKEK
jgi:PAS domain S-box-containing protein